MDAAQQDLDDTDLKQAELDAGDDQMGMEELMEAGRVLSALRDHTAEVMGSGAPIQPSTVMAIRTGVDMATNRVGGSRLPVIALESMDAGSLGVTLEAIGEKLKKVWEAIKAAFVKFFNSLMNLFKQRGQNAEKAAAATDQTIKLLAATPAETPPPAAEKVNKPNLLNAFTVGNKLPSDFLARIPAILKGLTWVFVDNGASEAHLQKLMQVMSSRPVDKLNDPELANDIVAFFTDVGKRFQAVKGDNTGMPANQAGDPLLTTGLLLGDVVIAAKVAAPGQSVGNAMAACNVAMWYRGSNEKDLTVPDGVTREQLTAALEASKDYLSQMASFSQGDLGRLKQLNDQVLSAGQQLVNRGTPETEGSLTTLTHQLNGYVHHVMNIREVTMKYGYKLCAALNALAKEYAGESADQSQPAA